MNDFADRIIGHYERHATAWDADRRAAAWNDRAWHDRFIASLAPGASVLDLGCGGGDPVARHMVERGLRVTGVDASPSLVALCRERMPAQDWIVADMRALSLGRRFDGILAWDSFFHLAPGDQRRMVATFAAHAAPAAMLMVNTGPAEGEAIGAYRGDALYHASLGASEYQALFARHGFGVVAHTVEDHDAGGRIVWLAQSRR